MGKPLTYRNRDLGDGFTTRQQVFEGRASSTRNVFKDGDLIGTLFHLDQGPRKGWYESSAATSSEYLGSTARSAVRTLHRRKDDLMSDLVQIEYDKFKRSADWELANIRKALNMLPFLNGPAEDARLAAVKRIQSERRKRRA